LPEAASYLRLCCVVSSAGGCTAAAAAAAAPIRQVDAFTDVIGFASASLTAVFFLPIWNLRRNAARHFVLLAVMLKRFCLSDQKCEKDYS